MPGDRATLRTKVQQYLTQNFNNVNVDRDGDYTLRHGSARIFVRTMTRDTIDWTWVNLWVPVLLTVKETPAVFEHVALHADDYLFGRICPRLGGEPTRGTDARVCGFDRTGRLAYNQGRAITALRSTARRDREGAPERLEHLFAGVRCGTPDRLPRIDRGLLLHGDRDDVQPRRRGGVGTAAGIQRPRERHNRTVSATPASETSQRRGTKIPPTLVVTK